MSSAKYEKLGKALAAGIKRTVRESRQPTTNLEGNLRLRFDNGEYMTIYLNGVPPFTTVAVDINGEVTTYLGHSEIKKDEQDTP